MLDGNLYFNGEKVKSISTFGGEKVFQEEKDREFGVDYNAEGDEEIVQNKSVEEENEIEIDGGDVTKIEEIKKLGPIQSISRVLGMQEIKNIHEIKPDVAENFIKKEKLENIVDDFHLNEQDTGEVADEIEIINEKIEQDSDYVTDEVEVIDEKIDELKKQIAILGK